MTGLDVAAVVDRGDFRLEVAFCVPPATTTVLVGPNGSGKSTLLTAIAGLQPLSGGRIALGGTVLADVAKGVHLPPARRRCGVVFQELRLFPALDVLDNVAFGARARGVRRRPAREEALRSLEALGIGEMVRRDIAGLSGGEAQRVALARAMVAQPAVLLLDEALSALDVRARTETRALLRRAVAALDVPRLVVTHDPVEALSFGERLLVLEHGEISWDGARGELPATTASPFLAALTGLNVVRGRLHRSGAETSITAGDVELVVVAGDIAEGETVGGFFEPTAVTVSTQRPAGSARNVVAAVIADLRIDGQRAHLRLDSRPPLHAEITAASVQRLGLRPGLEVWASVKATEVRVDMLD